MNHLQRKLGNSDTSVPVHGKVERENPAGKKKSITINMDSNRLSVPQWESLVAQVANGINNLPLGLGNKG